MEENKEIEIFDEGFMELNESMEIKGNKLIMKKDSKIVKEESEE